MRRNKFGAYIVIGALAGAIVSLFDKHTREQVLTKSSNFASDIRFYSTNRDVLKSKVLEKTEKYQSIYEQFSTDVTYLKEKIDELKELTPQVKEMVVETKDAFSDSKDEYKAIVNESSMGDDRESK